MKALLIRMIPVVVAIAAALAMTLWLRATPTPMEERLARPATHPLGLYDVSFPGDFTKFDVEPDAALPGSWPCFRGPDHNAVSRDETPLARTWPKEGPKALWSVPLGVGYAGAAILGGMVYVLDYDEAKKADTLRCLSLADGKEIWRRAYTIPIDPDHGVSRAVPAVNDMFAVTVGPKCQVMCVDSKSGDFKWAIDMGKEYGTLWPKWYAAQCPLIDMDRAILAPAGPKALMVGIDCQNGKTLWTTPNPRGWKMTHSSIVPVEFKNWRMYVYCGSGGIVAVSAEDGADYKMGDVLWEFTKWKVPYANVPTPVPIGDGRILFAGGYGAGSLMLQLKDVDDKLQVEQVWRLEKSSQFGSEQQTPIFYGGQIYGILPGDAGSQAGQLVCLDLAGQQVWASGTDHRFGLGPLIIADGLLFAMNDDGVLTMAEATSAGFKPLGTAKVLDGHETWAPMAIAGGRLLVRNLQRMVCLDVRKEP
jgi:outer membrane protein assembly factor BamB